MPRYLIWMCRLYLIGILLCGCHAWILQGTAVPHILVLIAIFAAIRHRSRAAATLSFCPDSLLVCLPLFWAWNLLLFPGSEGMKPIFTPHLLMLSAVILSVGGHWMRSEFLKSSLTQGIFLSLGFILVFFTAVKLVFPLFSDDLFRQILLDIFFVYGGIPVCQVAATGRGYSWDAAFPIS